MTDPDSRTTPGPDEAPAPDGTAPGGAAAPRPSTGLRIGSIVLNVSDVPAATAFWGPALGYRPKYAPEPDWVILTGPGDGPNLSLNAGATRPAAVPHVHLDLYALDQSAEVDRLVGLGARQVEDWPYPQDEEYDYVVLEDPDGNRFCVIDASGD